MSILGPGNSVVVQSAAGTPAAERAAIRDTAKKRAVPEPGKRRGEDELDLEINETETADAVRNLAGNDQEEAHDDRREHNGYRPDGGEEPPTPHIDVQA